MNLCCVNINDMISTQKITKPFKCAPNTRSSSERQPVSPASLVDSLYHRVTWRCSHILLTAFSALLLLLRNLMIGGCHGVLGHMRGFPVTRSSRRCLDQKSRAIFIQGKERIRCERFSRWVAWLHPSADLGFFLFRDPVREVSIVSISQQTCLIHIHRLTTGMSIEIPEGLTELLQSFTVEVLRNQPRDLLDFALQYFTQLKDSESKEASFGNDQISAPRSGKAVTFIDEAMQIDSENGEEEEDDDDGEFLGRAEDLQHVCMPASVLNGNRDHGCVAAAQWETVVCDDALRINHRWTCRLNNASSMQTQFVCPPLFSLLWFISMHRYTSSVLSYWYFNEPPPQTALTSSLVMTEASCLMYISNQPIVLEHGTFYCDTNYNILLITNLNVDKRGKSTSKHLSLFWVYPNEYGSVMSTGLHMLCHKCPLRWEKKKIEI